MAELGQRYRDIVTGFEGVATSFTEYLQGCRRVALERLDKDGAPQNFVFDEPNLEAVEGASVLKMARTATGGPHDHNSTVDTHR